MKKVILSVIFWAMVVATVAWAQEKYVRKPVTPNFFMPEQELAGWRSAPKVSKPQKVAPVRNVANPNVPQLKAPATVVNNNIPKDTGEPGVIGQPGFRNLKMSEPTADIKPRNVSAPEKKEYSPEDGLGYGLINDPVYRERMNVYEQDLTAISKTGKMPQNNQLKSDLDAMSSNLSFSVE